MPDEELLRLAAASTLRQNLPAQFARMLADARSEEFVRHFVGQWLQARDIDSVTINAFAVISRDEVADPEAESTPRRDSGSSTASARTSLPMLEKKELEQFAGHVLRLVSPFPRIRAER